MKNGETKMKYKILKLTNNWKTFSMEIKIPVGTWFNTSYETRANLYKAEAMTIAQFLTTSNQSIVETIKPMHRLQLELFGGLIRSDCYSKRSILVLDLINREQVINERR